MRPTYTEQLSGIATILRQQVLASIDDPLAASQVTTIADLLDEIAGSWGDAIAQLIDDNAALETLVGSIAPVLHGVPGLNHLGEIASNCVAESPPPGQLNFEPLNRRNLALREILAMIIEEIAANPNPSGSLIGIRASIRHEMRARLSAGGAQTSAQEIR